MLVRRARPEDVDGICRVCTDGYWAAYRGLLPDEYIARTVREFYNTARVRREVEEPEGWNGWYVALDGDRVVGAGGGGMTDPHVSELFVLYVDPARRGRGIGTRLLEAITDELRRQGGREQWVSVTKGNQKGIPFYRARGFVERGEQPAYGSDPAEGYRAVRMSRAL